MDVRFTYDINGLLEVEVRVEGTGVERRVVIERNPGVLSAGEIAQRLADLAALKVPAREQAENRALLARAGRVYEQSLGRRREKIGDLLARFEAILERQDPREIAQARKKFAEILDSLEGSPYL